jgi:hypothetical protein
MPEVFEDPDAVLALVRKCAPYRSIFAFHGQAAADDELYTPWFIDMPRSELLIENPRWIAAAREAFSAELVEPLHCTINVYGPAAASPPHMDLPVYRGMSAPEFPIWLLATMSASGLFLPWLVPVASGLVWFYRGEGGEFEYWPDGPQGRSTQVTPPMWNVGVMSDNEVMYHRVGSIGSPDEIASLSGRLKTSAMMHHHGESWEIRQDGRSLCSIPSSRLRVSLLWKAYVFSNEEHRASFRNKAYDLDLDQVTDIFLDDLERRAVSADRPTDPLGDPNWRALLEEAYKSPFHSDERIAPSG